VQQINDYGHETQLTHAKNYCKATIHLLKETFLEGDHPDYVTNEEVFLTTACNKSSAS
jgi:hypothetical protein